MGDRVECNKKECLPSLLIPPPQRVRRMDEEAGEMWQSTSHNVRALLSQQATHAQGTLPAPAPHAQAFVTTAQPAVAGTTLPAAVHTPAPAAYRTAPPRAPPQPTMETGSIMIGAPQVSILEGEKQKQKAEGFCLHLSIQRYGLRVGDL